MHRKLKYYLILGMPIAIGGVLFGGENASAVIKPTAELTIVSGYSDNVTGELGVSTYNPTATSEFYIPFKIHVEDTSSWNVQVVAENGKVDLTGEKDSTKILPSITTDLPIGSNQMTNHWGYRFSLGDNPASTIAAMNGMVYSRVPATETTIATGTPKGEETKYLTLGFGAKVDGSQPADTYRGKVYLYLTAEPDEITLFDMQTRGMTMQDMHPDYCRDTPTPSKNATAAGHSNDDFRPGSVSLDPTDGRPLLVPEVILKDIRDNNEYLIRKLADGNCWMSENLRFDFVNTKGVYSTNNTDTVLASSLKLTSDDTDIPTYRS